MENEPLFFEKQYFRQWWVWAIVLGLNGLTLFGLVSQVFLGHIFGDKPMSNEGLIATFIFQTALTIFILTQHLATKIDGEGVHIRFTPYHRKWKLYTWDEIAACQVKQYNPISEYGGWGLRMGAYNVSGNMGLLLIFKRSTSLMIGTQKHEEMKAALQKLNKL
jgi:hypothetical protein